jgi:hypothetical protein
MFIKLGTLVSSGAQHNTLYMEGKTELPYKLCGKGLDDLETVDY